MKKFKIFLIGLTLTIFYNFAFAIEKNSNQNSPAQINIENNVFDFENEEYNEIVKITFFNMQKYTTKNLITKTLNLIKLQINEIILKEIDFKQQFKEISNINIPITIIEHVDNATMETKKHKYFVTITIKMKKLTEYEIKCYIKLDNPWFVCKPFYFFPRIIKKNIV